MSIYIHYRVAKPSLLLYESPIPTSINIAVLVLCLIMGRLLTGIFLFFIAQLFIATISYYNVFIYEEYYAYVVTTKLFRKDNFYV